MTTFARPTLKSRGLRAIAQNNFAVSLLEGGEYRRAVVNFTEALEIFNQSIKNTSKDCFERTVSYTSIDQCMKSSPSRHHQEFTRPSSREEAAIIATTNRTRKEGGDRQHTGEQRARTANFPVQHGDFGGYMYRQAIEIPEEQEIDTVVLSTIFIFNLALAHHRAAYFFDFSPSTSKSQKDRAVVMLLDKAVRLYECAFNFQSQHKECDSMYSDEGGGNVLFSMAVFNNLGLIYRYFNEASLSTLCFQRLLSSLMYLVDCGEATSSVTSENVLDGFLHNALPVASHQSEVTAAAA